MFWQGFRVVRETPIGGAMDLDHLQYAECGKQRGHRRATNGVHRIHHHAEPGFPYGLQIHQVEREDGIDMLPCPPRDGADLAQLLHCGEFEPVHFGQAQHFSTIFRRDELPTFVEQL